MRGIIGTLALVFAIGYLATTIELPRTHGDAAVTQGQWEDGWRRTATGWEWQEQWLRSSVDAASRSGWERVHPLTVAALQVLVSLFALLAAELRLDEFRLPRATS